MVSHNTPLFWQVDLASRSKFQSRLVLQRTNPLLRSATETGTCPVRDAPQTEIKGLREAELVNHILAAALRYDLSIGDCDALVLGEVDIVARQERLIGLSWSVCRVRLE